jgi:L-seryl-tRNA(Ser) seleniumtransferase
MTDASLIGSLLPSVDALLRRPALVAAGVAHGRTNLLAAVRTAVADVRQAIADATPARPSTRDDAAQQAESLALAWLERRATSSLRRVFNLTGTVLHTNLGRAPLPQEAIEAIRAAAGACNVEYDLDRGGRGERDDHVTGILRRTTGAEAALVVNNNAAAVLLALNTLANRREVIVSRGELIEIGGSFRMPDVMARAGCKLIEVGTTNRTHLADFAEAIGPRTAAVMKVHPSNYAITGFTSVVPEHDLAALAHRHALPFIVDLGSGSLTDLGQFGLPAEPTPRQALEHGTDLVTFSADKLLGGPQAGLVVGGKELIDKLRRNPLKRALRLDKIMLAALAATLRLHEDPGQLVERLPSLRMLARSESAIRELAHRLLQPVGDSLGAVADVTIEPCTSQVGSGSLPVDGLGSWALVIRAAGPRRGGEGRLNALVRAFRALPVPVIGRLQDGALVFDLRCLEDEAAFIAQLDRLVVASR